MNIELTTEEQADLRALGIRYGTSPREILRQFAAEVTGSLRSRGSDERLYAEQWLDRTFLRRESLSDLETARLEAWQNRAWRCRREQQAAWKSNNRGGAAGTETLRQ